MCSVKKTNLIEKWGAIIGLIGGLIGALGGGLAIYDRWSQSELNIIGFAPVGVWTKHQDTEQVFQGISSIIRVQNNDNKPAYITGADIHGKVYLSYDEYWPIYRQEGGTGTNEDIKSEFMNLKPYRLISWVGWLSDHKSTLRIEPGEERFLKITFAEPTLSWGAFMYGSVGSGISQSPYIGYDGKGEPPKYINHNPAIQWFFKGVKPSNSKNIYPQDIKDEVKNGLIKIEVRLGTMSKYVDRDKITDCILITKAAWNKYPARKIYFDMK